MTTNLEPVVPAVPIVHGTTESVCAMLDRIERRLRFPDIDRKPIQEDLRTAQRRISALLLRISREVR